MCVFVHFMYSCMSALHRLRFGVESARVSVSVCGCAPRTLKGTGQSESTMNPGSPLGCTLKGHLQGEGWVQGVMHTQGKGDRDGRVNLGIFSLSLSNMPLHKPNKPSDSIM